MLARLVIGTLLILAISLAFFNMLMSPPSDELALMALFLGITAFASALVGYAAYRFGWVNRSPTLRWTLPMLVLMPDAMFHAFAAFGAMMAPDFSHSLTSGSPHS